MPLVTPSVEQSPYKPANQQNTAPFCSGMCSQKLNLMAGQVWAKPPSGINPKTAPLSLAPTSLLASLVMPPCGVEGCISTLPTTSSVGYPTPPFQPHLSNFSFFPVRPKHFTLDACLNDEPIALGFQMRAAPLQHTPFSSNHTALQAPKKAGARVCFVLF